MKLLGRDQWGWLYGEFNFVHGKAKICVKKQHGRAWVCEDDVFVGITETKRTAKATLYRLAELYENHHYYRIPGKL